MNVSIVVRRAKDFFCSCGGKCECCFSSLGCGGHPYSERLQLPGFSSVLRLFPGYSSAFAFQRKPENCL